MKKFQHLIMLNGNAHLSTAVTREGALDKLLEHTIIEYEDNMNFKFIDLYDIDGADAMRIAAMLVKNNMRITAIRLVQNVFELNLYLAKTMVEAIKEELSRESTSWKWRMEESTL